MKRIIVADDEANIRLLMEAVLTEEGHQITAVASGREALRKILKEDFDLGIFDIKMPDMNGLELIQRIRELKKTFPVVVCSAFKHLQDDYVIGTSGIAAYIIKPVNLDDFKNKIKEILEQKQSSDSG
ncbi:response regulator [candidate division TA06 bacterium]|uniref:Response regulator n=1 Tax=candidate division TA06 bacterium TaxID=2250710 RepID=A0A933IAH9_UNCT6|nr:response regulator [candidate division TA06 bacterium]